MGQKVHPTGIRLGVVKDHNSVWYADSKSYASQLVTDLEVREYILKRLDAASVSRVVIERPAQTARVTIHTARPGIETLDEAWCSDFERAWNSRIMRIMAEVSRRE